MHDDVRASVRASESAPAAAVRLAVMPRWLFGVACVASWASGAIAVFVTDVEAGPVALLAVGAIFVVLALSGVLPTRLKIGDSEAEFGEMVRRVERKAPEVASELSAAGVTSESAITGSASLGPAEAALDASLRDLQEDVDEIGRELGPERIPPDALIQLANWNATEQRWSEAARYCDLYVRRRPSDWEVQFLRGVCHTNSRAGRASNLNALNAYDAALAVRPDDIASNALARLLIYRGAVKKRLMRLEEAEADVVLGRRLADSPYELRDATYNLAAIKALQGDRAAALAEARELVATHDGRPLIVAHLDDYFRSLLDDPDFMALLREPDGES